VTATTRPPFAPALALADARTAAREAVQRSGSSFYFAMRLMPKKKRDAIYAVYAFARAVDDIADGEGDALGKCASLQEWRREVARIYGGAPETHIGLALVEPVRYFDLPQGEFLLLIDGMEADARGAVAAPSLEALFTYTRQVAGTVGLLSMRIFQAGISADADRFALALADALQLTNILRDVREDAENGRLYLPCDLLDRHGIRERQPMAVATHPALSHVCCDLGAVARARFAEAKQAMAGIDRRRVRPALMMMGVYQGYLERLEARNWALSGPPVRMGAIEKLTSGLRRAFLGP
jgi:presqualene diphosphate synthase